MNHWARSGVFQAGTCLNHAELWPSRLRSAHPLLWKPEVSTSTCVWLHFLKIWRLLWENVKERGDANMNYCIPNLVILKQNWCLNLCNIWPEITCLYILYTAIYYAMVAIMNVYCVFLYDGLSVYSVYTSWYPFNAISFRPRQRIKLRNWMKHAGLH